MNSLPNRHFLRYTQGLSNTEENSEEENSEEEKNNYGSNRSLPGIILLRSHRRPHPLTESSEDSEDELNYDESNLTGISRTEKNNMETYIEGIISFIGDKEIKSDNFEEFMNSLFGDLSLDSLDNLNSDSEETDKTPISNKQLKRAQAQLELQIDHIFKSKTITVPSNYSEIYNEINDMSIDDTLFNSKFKQFIRILKENNYFEEIVIKIIELGYVCLKDKKKINSALLNKIENIDTDDKEYKQESTSQIESFINSSPKDKQTIIKKIFVLFNNLLRENSIFKPKITTGGNPNNNDKYIQLYTEVLEQKSKQALDEIQNKDKSLKQI